jgi:hypothetical protein
MYDHLAAAVLFGGLNALWTFCVMRTFALASAVGRPDAPLSVANHAIGWAAIVLMGAGGGLIVGLIELAMRR